jgi:hypothetical protein
MIELLNALLTHAAAMKGASSTVAERAAWAQFHNVIQAQITELTRPPRVRPPVRP